MPNCCNCSAPLPVDSTVCKYCGTRNEVDLKGLYRSEAENPDSDRICPRCSVKMKTINVSEEESFLIEQCETCYGLFFDPGELDLLLKRSVDNVFAVKYKRLEQLKGMKRNQEYGLSYINCPVCTKLMNRINFGRSSGVIIDKCREHGVWLDGGELRQIMEWVKAGGMKKQDELGRERERIEKKRLERKAQAQVESQPGFEFNNPHRGGSADLGDAVIGFVKWLFK